MKIIQDPVKTAVTVFVIITLIVFAITFLKIDFFQNRTIGYYSSDFWQNILVEAHGMLFDLLIIGVLILWLDKKRDKANEVDKYCNEIDDFRDWKDDEAKYRIVGNLKRLKRLGVSRIDLKHCYLSESCLEEYIFSKSNFNQASVSDSMFVSSRFSECSFVETNLNNLYAIDVEFNKCNLAFSEFANSIFREVSFKHSIMDKADFSGSVFIKCDLSETNLATTCLDNVKCDHQTFFPKNFNVTQLQKYEDQDLRYYLSNDSRVIKHLKSNPELYPGGTPYGK